MPVSTSELKLPGHHFVIENSQGKVMVRVNNQALVALGAAPSEESLAATLERHMPRLRALAMQLAGGSRCAQITIRGAAGGWSSGRR